MKRETKENGTIHALVNLNEQRESTTRLMAEHCRSPELRKTLNLVLVTMLQADPHATHFKRILNFGEDRFKACAKIGVGVKTGPEWYRYKGLTPYDFRRSVVRNLINAAVDQATAMKITGHRALSVFQRCNIVSTEQLHAAMAKVSNNARTTQERRKNDAKRSAQVP